MRRMSFRRVTAWLVAFCNLWALAGSASGGLKVSPEPSREELRQRAAEEEGKQRAAQALPVAVEVPYPGRSWAVVIGINRYAKAPGAPALRFAEQDAHAVGAALGRQGFQVKSLLGDQATRAALIEELAFNLAERVGEADRVVIYYAGNAYTKTGLRGEQGYLMASNSTYEEPETAVSMKLIADLADLLPARQVLFLVDTCYSGITGRRVSAVAAPSGASPPAQQRGRQVLTAGSADEMSIERPDLGHGLFTYYLLKGIQGKADLNGDGVIPASELHAYVAWAVATFDDGNPRPVQHPELWHLTPGGSEVTFVADAAKAQAGRPRPGRSEKELAEAEAEASRLEERARQAEEELTRRREVIATRKRAALRRIQEAEEQLKQLAADRGARPVAERPADAVAAALGQSWAVVIGIDRYRNRNVPPLHYAVQDATAVGALLRDKGYTVLPLLNEEATADRIRELLGDELPRKVQPNDRVLIFFAMHGQDRPVTGSREIVGYLLPVDADLDRLHRTSIVMDEIKRFASLLPARHVLFLMDTCYAGIAGVQDRAGAAGTPAPPSAQYVRQLTKERGRQLITAGGADQKALEGPEWAHSVFTYYLLEGLGIGAADLNGDGVIPVSELYTFLDRRVFDAAQVHRREQRPALWRLGADAGEFVFLVDQPVRLAKDSPGPVR